MRKLLTPFDISKEPEMVSFEPGNYDHALQKSFGNQPMMSGYQTNSFNGTQTYGGGGQPADSDNDTDRNQ